MTESDLKFKESWRRAFLKGLTATPAAALSSRSNFLTQVSNKPEAQTAHPAQNQPAAKSKLFVGMQIGAPSFVDEGVDKCLDTLQETGGVNVVLATVFTYGT